MIHTEVPPQHSIEHRLESQIHHCLTRPKKGLWMMKRDKFGYYSIFKSVFPKAHCTARSSPSTVHTAQKPDSALLQNLNPMQIGNHPL